MSYFTARKTKKVELPSDSNYWVEIITDFKYGELKKLSEVGSAEQSETSDALLQLAIASWNLDDENGAVLEINQENIDRLNKDDVTAILQAASDAVSSDDDTKKNSSSQ